MMASYHQSLGWLDTLITLWNTGTGAVKDYDAGVSAEGTSRSTIRAAERYTATAGAMSDAEVAEKAKRDEAIKGFLSKGGAIMGVVALAVVIGLSGKKK
jgi:hypothetical protein